MKGKETKRDQLVLSGEVMNLLGYELRILDSSLKVQLRYPAKTEVSIMTRQDCSRPGSSQHEVMSAKAVILHPFVKSDAEPEAIGEFNGVIDLMYPRRSQVFEDWSRYWQEQVQQHNSYLRGMPDLKALNKRPGAMQTYCVVNPDVALMVNFQMHCDIDHVLVPTCPVYNRVRLGPNLSRDGYLLGFRALMPAQYLLPGFRGC